MKIGSLLSRAPSAAILMVAACLALLPVWGSFLVTRATHATAPASKAQVRSVPVAARLAAEGIVDEPVLFTVQNVDTTLVACNSDGRPYQIQGHLTAPQAVLAQPDRAITLYQHGIAAGEWYWRLDVPGYNHVEEMAKRGYASLTVDRLGYGASGKPNGLDTCVGAEADIAHQIVQQLRAGSYQVLGPDGSPATVPTPAFKRVFLAGQSNGGQITEIEAYSFQDVNGIVIMNWTDRGLTQQANARFFSATQGCLAGGSPARSRTDPAGYVYYDLGREEFVSGNFNDTDEAVLDAAAPLQNRNPCGDMISQLGAVMVDLRRLSDIKVPVLFLYGEKDARVQGGDAHRALFKGATDAELVTVPLAGHYMGLSRGAHVVHDTLAVWLGQR